MVLYLQEQHHIATKGLGGEGGEMHGNLACHTTSNTSAAELISCAGRKASRWNPVMSTACTISAG